MITSKEISEKQFSMAFRGYNVDEVDDFLDYIMDEIDLIIMNANKATPEAPSMQATVSQEQEEVSPDTKVMPKVETVQPILQPKPPTQPTAPPVPVSSEPAAASASDNDSAELSKLLQQLLITAQKTANDLVTDAQAEADRILSQARNQARNIVDEAKLEAESLLREKEDIVNYVNLQKHKYRSYLEDQLHYLDEKEETYDIAK